MTNTYTFRVASQHHVYLGTYEASSDRAALELFAKDAGFRSFRQACESLGFRAFARPVVVAQPHHRRRR